MLALVGTVLSRSASGNVLLRDGEGVLGTHRPGRRPRPLTVGESVERESTGGQGAGLVSADAVHVGDRLDGVDLTHAGGGLLVVADAPAWWCSLPRGGIGSLRRCERDATPFRPEVGGHPDGVDVACGYAPSTEKQNQPDHLLEDASIDVKRFLGAFPRSRSGQLISVAR